MRRADVLSVAFAAAALAVGSGPARADIQRIGSDGTVYRVDVETRFVAGRPSGTQLRFTLQRPLGGKDLSIIPGTDDSAVDRDPALEIDPTTGTPYVVWSRGDSAGFNLYVSRYTGSWSTPRPLVKADGDDIQPQLRFDDRYMHVSWRQDFYGQSAWWRTSFVPGTYEISFGPERIPMDAAFAGPGDGGGTDPDAPPIEDQYFTACVFNVGDGGGGNAWIWGVRDEPVPITYRQAFSLPIEVKGVTLQEASFLSGRFTFWFTTVDRLYYTTFADGIGWAPFRVVEIGSQTSASDARLLLTELNKRISSGGR
jgi:hypothetical protein